MNTIRERLRPYINRVIGINAEKPFHIDRATLIALGDDHFSLRQQDNDLVRHVPYRSILQVLEKTGGVEVGGLFSHRERFDIVIKIAHLSQPLAG